MIGIGIDVVEVDRFRDAGQSLIERLLTPEEREYALRFVEPAPSMAVRFAAKEAFMKSLGVGLGAFSFHEVEVVRSESGQPSLNVTGEAKRLADEQGVTRFLVSLSHTDTTATAIVIAE